LYTGKAIQTSPEERLIRSPFGVSIPPPIMDDTNINSNTSSNMYSLDTIDQNLSNNVSNRVDVIDCSAVEPTITAASFKDFSAMHTRKGTCNSKVINYNQGWFFFFD
jgi:hypothetical protein